MVETNPPEAPPGPDDNSDDNPESNGDDLSDDTQVEVPEHTAAQNIETTPMHHPAEIYGQLAEVTENEWILLPPDPEIVEVLKSGIHELVQNLQETLGIQIHDDYPVADMQQFFARLGLESAPVVMFEPTPHSIARLQTIMGGAVLKRISSGRPLYDPSGASSSRSSNRIAAMSIQSYRSV